MDSYCIEHITAAHPNALEEGTYFLIINAGKTPPHLGWLVDGRYYSLHVKGKNLATPFRSLLKPFEMQRTPLLLFQLQGIQQGASAIELILARYSKVGEGITCLHPIRDFFKEHTPVDITAVHFVFDLLPRLYQQNMIAQVQHLFMEAQVQEGQFCLPTYTMNDIDTRIAALNQPVTT